MNIFSIIELAIVPIAMIIVCAVLFKQSKSKTKTYGFRSLIPATIAIGYALLNALVICPVSFKGVDVDAEMQNLLKQQSFMTIVIVSVLSGIAVVLSIANIIYCLVKNPKVIEQPSSSQKKGGSLFKSIHNKYGFTLEDYDELSEDQMLTYQSLSSEKKKKFIESYLENHPNLENFQYFLDVARESISTKGFNQGESYFPSDFGDGDDYNPFLVYMNNITVPVKRETARIVEYFIDRGEIDPRSDWLYYEELYDGPEREVIFKIKALVYATNDSLQVNALKHITIKDLMDEQGRILPYNAMLDILNEIEIARPSRPTNKG